MPDPYVKYNAIHAASTERLLEELETSAVASVVDAIAEELAHRIEAGELITAKSMSDREFLAPLLEQRRSDAARLNAMQQGSVPRDCTD